ncbi:hypothetical protein QWI17_09220 [Gilvimarinus sp. SDUM040013]|uniref:HPr kinase/phosphorylase C-terminal domain-containing protein n=1 Tax=Gilvimarinus gilvus TaxID=3058038 RepID=A0ABU4RZY6_9GAMM|nr:hypothetical protein [Gilvimarinus sp. SDUM040013]MDO3386015.1 hypothetical protein [Gilvimarinus sp. SDUM040013]MDX6850469.1 hypothetical protein [Gilvimarinus sp. SDUM040013]
MSYQYSLLMAMFKVDVISCIPLETIGDYSIYTGKYLTQLVVLVRRESEGVVVTDGEETLSIKYCRNIDMAVYRLIRSIVRLRLLKFGFIEFPAACVELLGKGVLLLGASKSGKTELVFNLLKEGGVKLVGNDLVYCYPGTSFVTSLPTSIGVRYNTKQKFNISNIGEDIVTRGETRSHYKPRIICSIFEVTFVNACSVDTVVNLKKAKNCRLDVIDHYTFDHVGQVGRSLEYRHNYDFGVLLDELLT